MTSLITTNAPGTICQGEAGKTPNVTVVIQDVKLRNYGMIASSFSIVETGNVDITSSIGENLFVYCTNEAPVQITLKGVIGEIKKNSIAPEIIQTEPEENKSEINKKFPKFYEDYRVGKKGELLKITIDTTTYRAILLSYTRNYNTTPSVTDDVSLHFLAVREEEKKQEDQKEST